MIRIENLQKHYGKVHALDGLNMTVEPGKVYGFLGPNGAGKTTTLRILTGLACATSGIAAVAGMNVAQKEHLLSHRIGYLPEEPAFYPWMTPREFLDYLSRLHGLRGNEKSKRVNELLGLIQLHEVKNRRIGGFSRGMRQRLGLASALIHNPDVLLLDEPVSALDPIGRKEILSLIEDLHGHCTVLMSSHILADVERVCTDIGIINKGRMIVQSSREELMEEYAQPVFEVEADSPIAAESWSQRLQSQPWISGMKLDGEKIRITVKDINIARSELLRTAVQQKVILRRFEETRPSLEDVFLQLVDREVEQ